MRLAKSVVKELLAKNAEESRWSPEAIEAAGDLAEQYIAELGAKGYNNALGRGKKTVAVEDVAQTAVPTTTHTDKPPVSRLKMELTMAQNILRLEEAIRLLTKNGIKVPSDLKPLRMGSPDEDNVN